MIAFLGALAPFLPGIFSLLGFILKIWGASEKQLREFEALVQRSKDDGRISEESYNRLTAHQKAIEERLKAKKEQQK